MSIWMIIISALMYVFMMVMNTLANTLPLNGITTGDVSFKHPNLFQPTGMTFSIWGLIYILLLAYIIYQFSTIGKPISDEMKQLFFRVNLLFALSSLLNALWLISWHYDRIVLSTVIMVLLLVSLILIAYNTPTLGLLTRTAFSVYLGWITVATIANVTIMLVKLGIPGSSHSSVVLTALILVIGLVIALLWMIRTKDIAYGLVILWAYFGILMRHLSSSGLNKAYPLIYITTVASIFIVVLSISWMIFQLKG
jgi:hypothetical protein